MLKVLVLVLLALVVGSAQAKKKPPPPPPPSPVAVTRDAVVLINFTNDQSQPYTNAQARAVAFDGPTSAAAFYLEASYGKRTIRGDVFGWWTVPFTNEVCDTLAWKNAARSRALQQGVNLDTDYDIVSLVWPRTTACNFNSRAGTFHNGDFTVYSLAHELGHSMMLSHASGLRCTDGPLAGNCSMHEYGDIFDVMGANLFHFNGWEKQRLGWLTNTRTITASGRYTISPLERHPQANPQLLLIPRADGTKFTVELRESYGFDLGNNSDFTFNGVMIRVADAERTFLLDAHPEGVYSWFDAPFTPGETLVDPLGGASITVVSVSSAGAVVDVEVG